MLLNNGRNWDGNISPERDLAQAGCRTERVGLDQAISTLTFPQYKDWRNYGRLQGEIKALYELIQTGKRSYFD